MNAALNPAAWHDFYLGLLSASAALLGLFLVAMSLHLSEIEQNEVVRNRARITLGGLVGAISISLLVLAPNPSVAWLGAELIVVYAVYITIVMGWSIRTYKQGDRFRASSLVRILSNLPVAGLGAIAGLNLVLSSGPGLYLLFAVQLVVAPAATYNTWDVVFAPEYRRRKGQALGGAVPREGRPT